MTTMNQIWGHSTMACRTNPAHCLFLSSCIGISHTHSFVYCLCLLLFYFGRVDRVVTEIYGPQSQKHLPSEPTEEVVQSLHSILFWRLVHLDTKDYTFDVLNSVYLFKMCIYFSIFE